MSVPDIYGGKICAALDRQHPRDFFDIRLLLENEGLTDEIRRAFVVYLASHDRPMNELLKPKWKDIKSVFEKEFKGMTLEPVNLKDLLETRDEMLRLIHKGLKDKEKNFLLSLKEGTRLDSFGFTEYRAFAWFAVEIGKYPPNEHQETAGTIRTFTKYIKTLNRRSST